jgi:cytochrome c biogenesis protein ResB
MNGVLPANIGTFVMLLMFVAIVPGANFPGIVAGYLVHKIFFTVIGALVYVYLFASVSGSFDIQLGNVSDHVGLTVLIVLGAIVLVVMLVRIFWRAVKKLWLQAKQGGVIPSRAAPASRPKPSGISFEARGASTSPVTPISSTR